MKNNRLLITLLASLSFGLLAAMSVRQYLTTAESSSRDFEVLESKVIDLDTSLKIHYEDLQRQLNDLNRQLTSLQQVIAPANASEILTVAKMKEEILSRKEFEAAFQKTFEERWKAAESKLERSDDKLANIQNWIWGSLATIIVALCAASLFLLRRFTQVIAMLENSPTASQRSE